ncbi:hypothetical protein BD414DRAFT_502779 [Trametes punicea]|nr:hypothetical protein BD414DRAFT_502779 [Trametes punicea]
MFVAPTGGSRRMRYAIGPMQLGSTDPPCSPSPASDKHRGRPGHKGPFAAEWCAGRSHRDTS